MRWWLLALAALWAIWMITKPDKQKIEQRISDATLLAKDCKLGEAQGELIALRSGKANDEQLNRLQKAINDASPGCEKKRIRARAWLDAKEAVEKLVDDGENAKALARLSQFTRRYGESAETRALKTRIGPVRQPERAEPRVEAPSGALAREVVSARRLIDQAERDLKVGNYQAASNKMANCIATVEGGSRECAAFKVYADRLQQDLRRCLASGMEWIDHHCQ